MESAVTEKRPEADRGGDDTPAVQFKRLDVDLGKAREVDDDIAELPAQRHMQFIVRAFQIRFMAGVLHHDAVHIDVEIIKCTRGAFDDMVGHGEALGVRREGQPHAGGRVGFPAEVRISVEGVHFRRRETVRDDAVVFADDGLRPLDVLCKMV